MFKDLLLPETRKCRTITLEMVGKYGDLLGPIETTVAMISLEDKRLVDEEVFYAYLALQEDPLRAFPEETLPFHLQRAAADGLRAQPVTLHELKQLFGFLAESVENRSWLPDDRAYLKWVAAWLKLVDDKEVAALKQQYNAFGKKHRIPPQQMRQLLATLR